MAPQIKTILCPVDFSEPSSQATRMARTLAQGCGARIVALYVAPALRRYLEFQVSSKDLDQFTSNISQGAQSHMQELLATHFAGTDAEGLIRLGYAPEVILAVAEEYACDLIVMGTHGRRGVSRMVFGSVAEKVLKSSPVPVLTVRPES